MNFGLQESVFYFVNSLLSVICTSPPYESMMLPVNELAESVSLKLQLFIYV
jgi:hypothetical protein